MIVGDHGTRGVELIWPSLAHLPAYRDALERGWCPDNLRPQVREEELAEIAHDAAAFVASQVDREAKGPPFTMPDGRVVKRLPGYERWIWDGEFCGVIGFRWQPGTELLPPHHLGHIGYAVVPWKRNRGYATRALALLLPECAAEGLRWVELTTDESNMPSRRVIEANGGEIVERFNKPPAYGGAASLRYRIMLP